MQFEFSTAVTAYERPRVVAGGRTWSADRLFVCTGDDLQTLYPEAYAGAGLFRCKLQMMRTSSYGGRFRLGPMLAGGLTLRHYKNFQACPMLATVKQRVARENPAFDRFGVHVMASQNGQGELVLGDSHEYDADIEPFDKPEIDTLILDYLRTFLNVARPEDRGPLARHLCQAPARRLLYRRQPAPGVTAITGVGGAGMTLSFGLAEQVLRTIER